MKILLDNCVPYRVKRLLEGHEVKHTVDINFEMLKNGSLIAAAAGRFDVLVTTDKKIRHEQNLDQLPISVLELKTRYTRFADLARLTPYLEAALAATLTHRFVSVGEDGVIEKLAEITK